MKCKSKNCDNDLVNYGFCLDCLLTLSDFRLEQATELLTDDQLIEVDKQCEIFEKKLIREGK